MPSFSTYDHLLDLGEPELFVRRSLARIELDFRRVALSALGEWEFLRQVEPSLFTVVAALRRPSWGVVWQLIDALHHLATKMRDDEGTRGRATLQLLETLQQSLEDFERPISNELRDTLAPLGEFVRVPVPSGCDVRHMLSLPTALDYRVAQEKPSDVRWWSRAANALHPLVGTLTEDNVFQRILSTATFPAPWFRVDDEDDDGEVWTYYGLASRMRVRYTADDFRIYRISELDDARQSFRDLLGRDSIPEANLREFLGRLARREFIGIVVGNFVLGPPLDRARPEIHLGQQVNRGRKVVVHVTETPDASAWRARFAAAAKIMASGSVPHHTRGLGWGLDEACLLPSSVKLDEEWAQVFTADISLAVVGREWITGDTVGSFVSHVGDDLPDPMRVLTWMRQILSALHPFHEAGIAHLGLRPDDVIIDMDGELRLSCFLPGPDDLTSLGSIRPPEIDFGPLSDPPEPTADVFSVSALFYSVLTGEPFPGRSTDEGLTSPGAKNPAIPLELDRLIMLGLREDPAKRPANAWKVLDALDVIE